jgi:Zn-dependent protease
MLLAEPAPTPADVHFSLGGIAVRVSAWFWVGAALLGWGECQWLAGGDQRMLLRLLLAWVAVVFVSILVHEMGHALAWRAFGKSSSIVLYHLGGLTSLDGWGRRWRRTPSEQVIVSAAGPLVQLAFAAVIVAVLKGGGYAVPFPVPLVGDALALDAGREIPSAIGQAVVAFLLFVNIFWPILNLVPVPPLDGGQIVREGLEWVGVPNAPRIAAAIGAVCGCGIGALAMTSGQTYLAVLFFVLAASCIQSLGNRR